MDEPFDRLLEPVTTRFHQPWPATIANVLRFRRHAAAADCVHPRPSDRELHRAIRIRPRSSHRRRSTVGKATA